MRDFLNYRVNVSEEEIRINKFNTIELVHVMKAFHDRLREKAYYIKLNIEKAYIDKLFENLELNLTDKICSQKIDEILLEEICVVVHYYCEVKQVSREFQKLMEKIIFARQVDIGKNPEICKFLYEKFHESGMCSSGMMDLLYSLYT